MPNRSKCGNRRIKPLLRPGASHYLGTAMDGRIAGLIAALLHPDLPFRLKLPVVRAIAERHAGGAISIAGGISRASASTRANWNWFRHWRRSYRWPP